MPMEIKQHEEHLNALIDLITDGEQRAAAIEHAEALRSDYGSTVTDYNGFVEQSEKMKKENEALVISNSKLFRERAIIPENEQEQDEIKNDDNLTLESLGI